MNRSQVLLTGGVFLFGAIALVYFLIFQSERTSCHERGGVLVTGPIWYECVEPIRR